MLIINATLGILLMAAMPRSSLIDAKIGCKDTTFLSL